MSIPPNQGRVWSFCFLSLYLSILLNLVECEVFVVVFPVPLSVRTTEPVRVWGFCCCFSCPFICPYHWTCEVFVVFLSLYLCQSHRHCYHTNEPDILPYLQPHFKTRSTSQPCLPEAHWRKVRLAAIWRRHYGHYCSHTHTHTHTHTRLHTHTHRGTHAHVCTHPPHPPPHTISLSLSLSLSLSVQGWNRGWVACSFFV